MRVDEKKFRNESSESILCYKTKIRNLSHFKNIKQKPFKNLFPFKIKKWKSRF